MYDDLNILVVGDIMLDSWRESDSYKMSPEAPVPDIHNPDSTYTLGGAGNVARIVRELGARAQLVGVLGDFSPYSNNTILDLCDKADIGFYVAYDARRTTVKERIICHGQQVCRISEEDTRPVSDKCVEELHGIINGYGAIDGIIIADYSKGVMTEQFKIDLMRKLKPFPVLVDPKNSFSGYEGCTIFKPNKKEMAVWRPDWEMIPPRQLMDEIGCEYLIVTSEEKMMLSGPPLIPIPCNVLSHEVEVANVSGAGDAAAAVMLCDYVVTKDIQSAVKMANYAASQIVATEHTGHLDVEKLIKFAGHLSGVEITGGA